VASRVGCKQARRHAGGLCEIGKFRSLDVPIGQFAAINLAPLLEWHGDNVTGASTWSEAGTLT